MRRTVVLLSALALAAALFPVAAFAAPPRDAVIVVFNDSVENPSALASEMARQHGFRPTHVYQHALKGFAATVTATAATALRNNPEVAWVEADGTAYMSDSPQSNATWGIDRIDQRELPLSTTYNYAATGTGVTAYVIDSGILSTHTEFRTESGTRVTLGKDFVGTNDGEDCNGHGTHVAGTIGGTTYGVAKNVSLVSVRVFDCTGGAYWSTIIAAVDWVTADVDPDKNKIANKPAVANMSLGGGANDSVDAAVRNSIASGVSYAIAAGNGDRSGKEADACNYSPARVTEAMTISATNSTDTKASWANYGDCVDWFAPGVSIKSAWIDSDSATKTISGTSMATPHTAGVAALYLQGASAATPATVRDALYAATTKGVVTSSSTANNHLAYNLYPEGYPSAAITNPTGGAVAGTVTITVDAADVKDDNDGDPATSPSVTISIDSGHPQPATLNADTGNYELPWDVSLLDEGSPHTIDATATDSDGLSTAAARVNVTVDNVNDAPTVSIAAPAEGDTVAGTVTVQVAADDDRDGAGTLAVTVTVDAGTAPSAVPVTFNAATGFYEGSWDTTALGNGTLHTIDATATDTKGAGLTGSATRISVTVDNSVPTGITIASLTGSNSNQGPTWTAIATVVIQDASNKPIDNATVSGNWTDGTTGTGTCVTGEDGVPGTCTIEKSGIAKKNGTVQFTVTSVTHATMTWDNVAQSVIIAKP